MNGTTPWLDVNTGLLAGMSTTSEVRRNVVASAVSSADVCTRLLATPAAVTA